MERNDCTGMQLSLQKSCCRTSLIGPSLMFNLIQLGEDDHDTINGVPVVMDEATKEWTKDMTIELKSGRLSLQREGHCCG